MPLICRFERGGNAPVNDGAVNGDALCTCRLFDKSRVCTRSPSLPPASFKFEICLYRRRSRVCQFFLSTDLSHVLSAAHMNMVRFG